MFGVENDLWAAFCIGCLVTATGMTLASVVLGKPSES